MLTAGALVILVHLLLPNTATAPILRGEPEPRYPIFIQKNSIIATRTPEAYQTLLTTTNASQNENLSGKKAIQDYIRESHPTLSSLLIELIQCENHTYDPNRCGDKGTSCGILQFKKATFDLFCEGDWKDNQDQIDCSVKMIKGGLGSKIIGWQNCWQKRNLWKYGF